MRIVIIVVIVAALGIAGVTAALIQRFLTQQTTVETAQPQVVEAPKTKILVASMDLPAGKVIAEGSLGWRDWPADALVPQGELLELQYIKQSEGTMKGMIGKAMLTGVLKGQPLTPNLMFDPGEGGTMAQMLMPGMRAFALKVDDEKGVAGFVTPGDRVDVFISFSRDADSGPGGGGRVRRFYSEPILVNVRILAIDQTVDDLAEGATLARTVTLEVLPKQVEVLAVARDMGRLWLALHSLAEPDKSPYVGNFTTDAELSRALGGAGAYRDAQNLGATPSKAPGSEARSKETVTVHRSTVSEDLEFTQSGEKISVPKGPQIPQSGGDIPAAEDMVFPRDGQFPPSADFVLPPSGEK